MHGYMRLDYTCADGHEYRSWLHLRYYLENLVSNSRSIQSIERPVFSCSECTNLSKETIIVCYVWFCMPCSRLVRVHYVITIYWFYIGRYGVTSSLHLPHLQHHFLVKDRSTLGLPITPSYSGVGGTL